MKINSICNCIIFNIRKFIYIKTRRIYSSTGRTTAYIRRIYSSTGRTTAYNRRITIILFFPNCSKNIVIFYSNFFTSLMNIRIIILFPTFKYIPIFCCVRYCYFTTNTSATNFYFISIYFTAIWTKCCSYFKTFNSFFIFSVIPTR